MAVVTGNTFTVQKIYPPASLAFKNSHIIKFGIPEEKVNYYITGGTANTVFSQHTLYYPTSMLGNVTISTIGIPKVKLIYPFATGGANTAEPLIFSEQVLYFPINLDSASSTQSYRTGVTGRNPIPRQFWS